MNKEQNNQEQDDLQVSNESNVMFFDEEQIFTMTGDDGEDVDFVGIAFVEMDKKTYLLAQPVDDDQGVEDDEAVIFKVEPQDEEIDLYLPVLDEELGDKIFEEYLRATAEEIED